MKIKNILKIAVVSGMLAPAMTSCSDWLQVDLEDSILESALFETNDGYTSALNGVYAQMNEQYSSTLTMGTLDVMAKLYNTGLNHNSNPYYTFAFDDSKFESMSNSLWTSHYFQIANLNTLLEFCDLKETALKDHYRPYVQGEALALRAMLHFDLLRIYGPIYSEETASTVCMPYQETTSKEIQPMLPASEVIEKVIRDLNAAAELLKDDRIRTEGVMNGESEDANEGTDFRYRQFRMNYYAVQGLLARAYLWKGDKESAYTCAKAIIDENKEKEVFVWTPKANVQSSKPDLIFSTEVMFALYNKSRVNTYDALFNPKLNVSSILSFAGESMSEGDESSKMHYFYPDLADLRRTEMWSIETVTSVNEDGEQTEQNMLCFSKFKDITTSETRRYMVPLLRLSEMYLIAAECTDDLAEALGYINEIRAHRNCVNLAEFTTEEEKMSAVDAEFGREMIGEGQIYFYNKRLAKEKVLSGLAADYEEPYYYWEERVLYATMAPQEYVWPLPDVEKDKRAN